MIRLYCTKRNLSSSKAVKWFTKYGINICIKSPCEISREELITVLSSTDRGIFDIIKGIDKVSDNDKSKIRLMYTMTVNQAIDFIKENPNLLKVPIIIDNKKVLIGYNPDQIRMFLPKMYRRKSLFCLEKN